ncbi:uncharacterized protein LOC142022807 [Carettochelys insculpta]|uniref:uncharacterized protein LOC142022807 n=1 Tax=Carettochelys insculpta TaxID=44489 RepID=UPI003EB9E3F5
MKDISNNAEAAVRTYGEMGSWFGPSRGGGGGGVLGWWGRGAGGWGREVTSPAWAFQALGTDASARAPDRPECSRNLPNGSVRPNAREAEKPERCRSCPSAGRRKGPSAGRRKGPSVLGAPSRAGGGLLPRDAGRQVPPQPRHGLTGGLPQGMPGDPEPGAPGHAGTPFPQGMPGHARARGRALRAPAHPSVRIKGTEHSYSPVLCQDDQCAANIKGRHTHRPFCSISEAYQDLFILRAHYWVKHVDKGLDFAGSESKTE